MTPVEEAIEAAARARAERLYGPHGVEATWETGVPWVAQDIAAFLKSIAGSPTPEMVEASRSEYSRMVQNSGDPLRCALDAALSKLAEQVEERRPHD